MSTPASHEAHVHAHAREPLTVATVRFAGDSGDGMQLTGSQFAHEVAWAGNDLATLPNYPAEIRAPAGTLYGVSSYQIQFGSIPVFTPGDQLDALVAMNPAALKVHLPDLKPGGILIVNRDAFVPRNLQKAGYESNPLDDPTLRERYRLIDIEISTLTHRAVEGLGLSHKEAERCKNFFALGVVSWLFNRPVEPVLAWLGKKFANRPELREANARALKAGLAFADTLELIGPAYDVAPAHLPPGLYRRISGNQALALGLLAAAHRSGLVMLYGSYPITPASDVLHEMARLRNFRVRTFQAEDEIAAVGAAIGAAFGGGIGVCGTSGPGLALKSEAIGLAVMTELPIVVVDVQRGGPSTGLPTRTEQADLLQAMYGRNGECPVVVLAPATPGDCFHMAFEAVRIALEHMTPVLLLTDGYLGNGSEPWRIPELDSLPEIRPPWAEDPETFAPYARDPETLARRWAPAGRPGFEHRIGGLEKQDGTGNVSYDPDNHDHMVRVREEKVRRVAREIPPLEVQGADEGEVLVVGWGSTYGAIHVAVSRAQARGHAVSAVHLRHLNPFPPDLGPLLGRFRRVLVPEINRGQLLRMLRAEFLVDAVGFNRVRGLPLHAAEIEQAIEQLLEPGARTGAGSRADSGQGADA
ncbi:MAG: 2-oxoacid:acceptor oxidoreductase subunit alpha [Planctomycetota bacterium]|nr:MAG: 2-oxoacid:acceptor oxidoreductase subunit alpha [Planctomycetota bacterium]